MSRLVGLCGYAGAGKSTAAAHLVNNHCYKRHSFADPIKAACRALGLTEDHVNGKLKELPCAMLGGKTPRFFMQRFGTEFAREMIHPDFWVLAWQASLPNGTAPGVVADDVRFANERLAIKRLGGILVEVHRPGIAAESGHASEVLDFVCDRMVINSGSVLDLQRRLDQALGLGMG